MRDEKLHAGVARSTRRSQNVKSTHALLKVQMWFCLAGARDSAPCQKQDVQKRWKDACRLAGAVQETSSSEMLGGQGDDFLRGVALWSIRFSGLLR